MKPFLEKGEGELHGSPSSRYRRVMAMTGEDVKLIRKALGLTQSQLAEWLRLQGQDAGQTVRSWEAGRRPVTGPAEVAMTAFADGWRPPHVGKE
jgi:DNA-binding transcriptional regulator YiaG